MLTCANVHVHAAFLAIQNLNIKVLLLQQLLLLLLLLPLLLVVVSSSSSSSSRRLLLLQHYCNYFSDCQKNTKTCQTCTAIIVTVATGYMYMTHGWYCYTATTPKYCSTLVCPQVRSLTRQGATSSRTGSVAV